MAIDLLHDSAELLGQLTRDARLAEHMVKVTLSMVMKDCEADGISAIAGQERDARASKRYQAALAADAQAAGKLAEARATREAAMMLIEVFRTMEATKRALRV